MPNDTTFAIKQARANVELEGLKISRRSEELVRIMVRNNLPITDIVRFLTTEDPMDREKKGSFVGTTATGRYLTEVALREPIDGPTEDAAVELTVTTNILGSKTSRVAVLSASEVVAMADELNAMAANIKARSA